MCFHVDKHVLAQSFVIFFALDLLSVCLKHKIDNLIGAPIREGISLVL